ncbi:MAG: glycosyltransferase [Spirochaetales bacterium]|nr:glycosyltransferase [Spirochaetales bacterium]
MNTGSAAASNRTIRILHVITSLGKGGAETMLFRLLEHRSRSGFEHFVMSLTGEGRYGSKIRGLGVPVLALRLHHPGSAPAGLFRAVRRCVEFKPDIVQGWMYHANVAASLLHACRSTGTRLFWNVRHSLHFFNDEKFSTRNVIRLNRLLSRGADCCIFNSRTSHLQHARFGFASKARATVPNGFDTDVFRPDPAARAATRRRYGLTSAETVVGLVGRYHPLKDYHNYLAAVSLIRKTAPAVRFATVIAGKGLTRENAELRASLDRLPPRERIVLIDESDDVPALMNGFDVLCLPSRSEAFPNVVGEAMSTGVPCVATDVGDAAYIVGDTGIVVPPKNPRALAEALEKAVSLTAAERTARGKAARRRILSHFSIGAVASQYEALYQKAVGTRE